MGKLQGKVAKECVQKTFELKSGYKMELPFLCERFCSFFNIYLKLASISSFYAVFVVKYYFFLNVRGCVLQDT
jgi:hypothetical protein